MKQAQPHYHGHRDRLRARFLHSGLVGLADYEIVELLLTLALPRSDVKVPAKQLLERFGTLRGILDAQDPELKQVMRSWSFSTDLRMLCHAESVITRKARG